jgi:mono/diheme cytochrome c family protein
MKKKFLVAAFFVALVTTFFIGCGNNETKASESNTGDSAAILAAKIETGSYLAHNVSMCMDCHSPRDPNKFSMPVIKELEGSGANFPFSETEGVPGTVWPPNITPFALKDWTDDEIVRAFTKGINKKGDTLFPIMPYHGFSRMTDEDAYAIVAYLRTLKPIDSVRPPRNIKIPTSMYPPLPNVDLAKNEKPDPSDKVKYGEYMIIQAACGECHTPRTPKGEPMFDKAYSGGFVFNTPFFKVTTANITPDSATGIGTWTEDAFVAKFRNNAAPEMVNTNPGRNNTIMPWSYYGKMKEQDLRAIYAYLRTVPAVPNKLEKWPK